MVNNTIIFYVIALIIFISFAYMIIESEDRFNDWCDESYGNWTYEYVGKKGLAKEYKCVPINETRR